MKRLPRVLPRVAVACSLSMPLLYVRPLAALQATAPADNAPMPADTTAPPPPAGNATDATAAPAPAANDATAAPAATEPAAPAGATTEPATTEPAAPNEAEASANKPLADQVDDFWHYGEVARYDLQAQIGKRLIEAGQQNPSDLLKVFEQVSSQHTTIGNTPTDLDTELLRWQAADPQMRPVAAQLMALLNKGRFARRQDQQYIAENIKQLNQGERAYSLAIQQLRNSGELAVPQMVNILVSQRPEDQQYHDVVRQALIDLGREALNPLLAATQMNPRDPALTTICAVLGEIGYPISAPYLTALTQNPQASNPVRMAATAAIQHLSRRTNTGGGAGDQFYALAEQYYYGNASIQPDPRSPRAFVWYWTNAGLSAKPVPPPIFNDIMAMRESEHALRWNAGKQDQAVALWLAANVRRAVDLPQGETDPTRGANEPPPAYYNSSAGAQYLNLVLDRSLKDNTPQSAAVALAAIKSLQGIAGQSNLFSGGRGEPLVEAMRYSDRQVRFEAAFALAAALPQKPFQGYERVVPLLAEAVSQNGTPGVLVVAPQNDRTRLAADLKGYATAGGTTPASAIADAAALPAVDVMLVSEDLGNSEIDRLIDLANNNPRLERAAKVIIVHSLASPWARMAVTDPTITATQATAGPTLLAAIEQARKRAGGLSMDEKVATDFALRSANLLARLAISRGQVLNLAVAEPTLIAALGDKRPQIAKAVGDAVALLNSRESQSALADRAGDASAAPDVRISLYRSLATSAKFYGNRLDPNQLRALQQAVAGERNLEVRSAAAEARGALNLPAGDARALIIQRRD